MNACLVSNPIFFALLLLASVLYLALSFQNYKKAHGERMSLLTIFPFEGVQSKGKQGIPVMVALLCFCLFLASPSISGFAFVCDYPGLSGIGILECVVFLLSATLFYVINLVPAYKVKPHQTLFCFYGVLVLMNAALGVFFFQHLAVINETMSLIFTILCALWTILCLLILANPKLARWAEMKSEMSEDGTVTLVRPRPFPLAFSEWLLVLVQLLNALTFLVAIFLFALELA